MKEYDASKVFGEFIGNCLPTLQDASKAWHLWQEAGERWIEEGRDSYITYTREAWDLMAGGELDEFKPDASDVADRATPGDWDNTLMTAATITLENFYHAAITQGIESIKDTVDAAELEGFTAIDQRNAIHAGRCPWGDIPHSQEIDAGDGVIFVWTDLEGSGKRAMLHIPDAGLWWEMEPDEE